MKTLTKKFMLIAMVATAITAAGTGCREKTADEKMKDSAGDAGNSMKDAAQKTGDAVKEGAQATKDAVTNAVNSMSTTNK